MANGSEVVEEEECSICSEQVGEAAMHCVGTAGRRHQFHGRCLTAWIDECRRGSRSPTCPNCRGPVEVHAERLTSQTGVAQGVREFLTEHVPGSGGSSGWVRVGSESVLDRLREQFATLDSTLTQRRVRTLGRGSMSDVPERSSRAIGSASVRAAPSALPTRQPRSPVGHVLNDTCLDSPETIVDSDSESASGNVMGRVVELPVREVGGPEPDAQSDDPIGDFEELPHELPTWHHLWPRRAPCDFNEGAARSCCDVGPVTVHFPFEEVFPPQAEVITNTVRAVLSAKHAVIESPTGTGKTMALLCAALGAQRHLCEQFGAAPRIVFCTRTHQQAKQVVKESRRAPYRPWVQIIGSREQGFCIESEVLERSRREGARASHVCQQARRVADRAREDTNVPGCTVWKRLGQSDLVSQAHQEMRCTPENPDALLDVEDLGALGRRVGLCPYFLSTAALQGSELVVCPYNYVLDRSIASAMDVLGEKPIVVIDEGHNVEAQCREAGSAVFTQTMMMEMVDKIDKARTYFARTTGAELHGKVVQMIQVCSDTLAAFLETNRGELEDEESCKTWNSTLESAPIVAAFLEACGVTTGLSYWIMEFEQAILRSECPGRLAGLQIKVMSSLNELKSLSDALDGCREQPSHYKVHISAVKAPPQQSTSQARAQQGTPQAAEAAVRGYHFQLSVLLVNPEAVFTRLAESTHSVIIASGTLAPTAGFVEELGRPFAIRLLREPVEAPHIIDNSQFRVAFQGHSRDGVELKCIRQNMLRRPFIEALGQTLVDIVSAIPDGVFVFFPSRSMLKHAVSLWQSVPSGRPSLWSNLQTCKGLVATEPDDPDGGQALARHEEAVRQGLGALLFCVYRGRSSEGVSLSDRAVRGVVCVGIPLAPRTPAVVLKRDYNDAVCRSAPQAGAVDGETWYNLGAYRAVNQALGRVIRHRQDFGAAVLVDSRWTARGSLRAVKYLPRWLRELHGCRDDLRGEALCVPLDHLLMGLRQHFVECERLDAQDGQHFGTDVDEDSAEARRVRPRSRLA